MEKSKISNVEWGLVIGLFICIDIAQIGIDFIPVVGEIANVLIDIAIQGAFALYLHLRGVQLGGWKMIANMALNFLFKEITLGALPLWTLEAVITMGIVKSQDALADGELFSAVSNVAGKASRVAGIGSKVAGLTGERGETISQNLKQFSSRADSVKQAADAAQRNQLKIQGQTGSQFASPYRTQDQQDQINLSSTRAAQLAIADQASKRNQSKFSQNNNLRPTA